MQMPDRKRDLALFNLAIDSKLRGCDLVRLQADDVCAWMTASPIALLSHRGKLGGPSSSG